MVPPARPPHYSLTRLFHSGPDSLRYFTGTFNHNGTCRAVYVTHATAPAPSSCLFFPLPVLPESRCPGGWAAAGETPVFPPVTGQVLKRLPLPHLTFFLWVPSLLPPMCLSPQQLWWRGWWGPPRTGHDSCTSVLGWKPLLCTPPPCLEPGPPGSRANLPCPVLCLGTCALGSQGGYSPRSLCQASGSPLPSLSACKCPR